MKLLVFVLVLANALFYAFANGYFGQPGNPDAGRVEQQLNPERLRIVSRGEAPAVTKAQPAAGVVSPPQDATPESEKNLAEASPATEKAAAEPYICLIWRQLAPGEADRLAAVFGKRFGDYKLSSKAIPSEGNGWWVSIPVLPSKADADRKAAELREMGVTDFMVIQDGANRNAISLGVFSAEKGAKDRLAEVKAKGVRSAVIGPRPGKEESVTLQARGPAGERAAVLRAAAEALPRADAQACK